MIDETSASKALRLLMLAVLVISGELYAQPTEPARRDQQETRQASAISQSVYDKIQQAQKKISEDDNESALQVLDGLIKREKLTEYERSQVLRLIGFVHYNIGNVRAAITTFEEILRVSSLEIQLRKQALFILAQLTTADGQHTNAIRLLENWFALEPNPGADPNILYAQNLYQVERYKDMAKPIETAMQIAQQRGNEIKENWYVLLSFAYFQQENYGKVRDIHKLLLATWPTKRYWITLAGAYAELGDEKGQFAAYHTAHEQGLLKEEAELVTMVQLYLQQEVPYNAARLLEAEIEVGRVSASAKNYRLLSQAWSLAREDEKAIPALRAAANLSDNGELDFRLGNAYLNLSRFPECVSAIQVGLSKGGLKNTGNAQISLGMCFYNQHEYTAAIRAFNEAGKTPATARVAREWLQVIERDQLRDEQIRFAEARAREQMQRLADRREAGRGG